MEPLRAKCPICRKPTVKGEEYFPFCSERCQLLDLGAWSSEEYKIPGPPANPDDLFEEQSRRDRDDEIRNR